MALPLTQRDKDLLLSALGLPETRDRVVALLDLAGTGNMTGPAVATDNALSRFDGTTGALVQNSGAILDDSNNLSGIALLSATSANISGLTASKALQTDASNNLQSSAVSTTELGFLSGVTSSVLGKDQVGTFTNKTLTSPTINSGALSGTFSGNHTISGIPSFSNIAQFSDGTAAAPAITFTSDTDTGFYNVAANTLGVTLNGAQVAQFSTAFFYSFQQSQGPNGSAATPSFSFNSDTNTGIYRIAADTLGFSTNGTNAGQIDSTQQWSIATTTDSTSSITGSFITAGGLGVAKRLNVAGRFSVGSTGGGDTGVNIGSSLGTQITGAAQFGLYAEPSFSGATTSAHVISGRVRTDNSAFTMGIGRFFHVEAASKGASDTITRLINYSGVNQTVGTNNAFIADNTAFTGNFFINQSGSAASSFGGTISTTGAFNGANGTAGAVTYGFTSSVGSGLYRNSGSENLQFATNSTNAGQIDSSQQWSVATTTDSSSSTTGSFITAGGVGIAKKLYVGTGLAIGGVINVLGNSGQYVSSMAPATAGGTSSNLELGSTTARATGGTLSGIYWYNSSSNVTAAQVVEVGGTGTNYGVMYLRTLNAGTQKDAITISEKQNVIIGSGALATNATDGFLYIETCAGTPTGTPTSVTGRVATVYDTTNNKFYVYNGAWKSVTLA